MPRAEHWRWSSLWRRVHGDDRPQVLLPPWPLPLPDGWVEHVNALRSAAEVEGLRRTMQRGCPIGSIGWQKQMAARLGLGHTLRPLGRPKKALPPQAHPAKGKL